MKNVLIFLGALVLIPAAASAQQATYKATDTSAVKTHGAEVVRIKQLPGKSAIIDGRVRAAFSRLATAPDSALRKARAGKLDRRPAP
jgi:hypothetical protein